MDLIRMASRPFIRLGRLLFRTRITLRVRGGLRLEWVDLDCLQAPSPEQQRAARERADLDLMLREVKELLDADVSIRDNLRHLSYVEQALQKQGLSALNEVPLQVLGSALDQFEGLVTNWGPRGLAGLRSRMSVAASARSDVGEDDTSAVAIPTAPPARKVTVASS